MSRFPALGRRFLAIVLAGAACGPFQRGEAAEPAAPQPIAIDEIKRAEPVVFETEVLPILSRKCLACHNATTRESQLVLETPASIRKGGESGPAVRPDDPAKSPMLLAASQRGDSPMPPPGNVVGAAPLTSAELGLIKLWIEQGATGGAGGAAGRAPGAAKWQPLPSAVNPIYAVAMTEDGQWAACSRADQIFIYHVPSGRLTARLADPALAGRSRPGGAAHLEMVHSLAFSPDGSLLVSGGYREIKLWRRPVGSRKYTIGPEPDAVTALATSRDGRRIATGHRSGAIKIWDADSGRPLATLADGNAAGGSAANANASDGNAPDRKMPDAKAPGENRENVNAGAVLAIDFLRNSALVAAASADKRLRVWNVPDGVIARRVDLPSPADKLAVMSGDLRLAAAGSDGTIFLWTIAGDTILPFASAPAPVTALVASPSDPNRLFSGHADHQIRYWDVDGKRQAGAADQGDAVTALAVRGDGQQLASAGANGAVKLWRTDAGEPWPGPDHHPLAPLAGDFAASMAVGRWERRVAAQSVRAGVARQAAADADALIKSTAEAIAPATSAREAAARVKAEKTQASKEPVEKKAAADKAAQAAAEDQRAADERLGQANRAAESNLQDQLLANARDEARRQAEAAAAKLKSAETLARDLAPAAAKAVQELLGAENAIAAAEQTALAAEAAHQKALDAAPPAKMAEREAEQSLRDAQAHLDAARQAMEKTKQPIRWLAYSPNHETLSGGGANPIVSFWDVRQGVAVDSQVVGSGPVMAGGFAGGLLIALADGEVSAWNQGQDWALERVIGAADTSSLLVDRVLSLAFSPDGTLLASGGGEPSRSGELNVWNVADGSLARAISPSHSDTIFAVEFSPNGRQLASAGADRMMKVFDLSSGSPLKTFEGHTHHVLGVAWRADGKLLATAGADNSVKFWDVASGEQTRPAYSGGKEHTAVRFLALSSKTLVAGADRTVRMIDAVSKSGAEHTFTGPTDFLYALAVSGDGKTLIAGGQDSVLWVWNVDSGQLVRKFDPPTGPAEPAR